MFTLAQYVLGIGKPDLIDSHQATQNEPSCYEHETTDQCVQTNIENDWILIELANECSTLSQNENKTLRTKARSKANGRSSRRSAAYELLEKEKIDQCSSPSEPLENLYLEHTNVFDHLFTKPEIVKSESKVFKKKEKNVKTNKNNDGNNNNKENSVTLQRSTKKPMEVKAANVLPVSNQNKALTAVFQSGEALNNKKKCITKKNYTRQNKVSIQRNGPIIRQKKMFTHLNGAYFTRQHC